MVEAEEVAEATEPLPHLLAMEPLKIMPLQVDMAHPKIVLHQVDMVPLKIMPLQVDTVHLRTTPPVEVTELPRTTHLAVDMAPKRS